MTACPKCGAALEEGKAYCSDPACGAVLPAHKAGTGKYIVVNKEANLNFNFVLLARLAALAIAALAAALLYFTSK